MTEIVWYNNKHNFQTLHYKRENLLVCLFCSSNLHQSTHFKQRAKLKEEKRNLLTICCHANIDAFFEATFLTLVSCHFVYHTFSFIFTGIGWMEIFLNGSSKKSLSGKENSGGISVLWFFWC